MQTQFNRFDVVYPLKSVDISALKKADRIIFRSGSRNGDAYSRIECLKKKSEKERINDPFGGEYKEHLFTVKSNIDEGTRIRNKYPSVNACYSFYSSLEDEPIYTLTHYVIRKGDTLKIKWGANNTSDLGKRRGVTEDSVELVIERPTNTGNGVKFMHFLLEVQVVFLDPDDSGFSRPHRMVHGVDAEHF
jgi:hypothetical protein